MSRTHQPDESVFSAIRSEDLDWAKSGEYVTQVTALGPLGLAYVDGADDPRLQRRMHDTSAEAAKVVGDPRSASRSSQ